MKQTAPNKRTREKEKAMTREDLIVLCEEAINNLEEVRAYLVNEGEGKGNE